MPVSSQRLAGKTAVITGTAGGQGRAAALAFAAAGAVVVGCDMDDDGSAGTVGQVTAAGGRMSSSAPHGLRVNAVSPGMIRTAATEGDLLAPDHPMRTIAGSIPLARIGAPEEVANCALFLASDEASYVTGANLMVDGGWSAVLPG
jgi:NAD(P)-dependent dehydrogenase (short-subunit alcohol dehydrogenase family)